MDPKQIVAQALPLPHHWTVTSSALGGKPGKLTLIVGLVERTKRLPCPCRSEESRIHDRRERRWRHLNFWQYETELASCAAKGAARTARRITSPLKCPGTKLISIDSFQGMTEITREGGGLEKGAMWALRGNKGRSRSSSSKGAIGSVASTRSSDAR